MAEDRSFSAKIKVIYLINELGKGGSERQLYLLLKNADQTRLEPIVVVFNRSTLTDYADDLKREGIAVISLPESASGIWRRTAYLIALFRKEQPDIVHSWSTPDNPYAGIAGWLAGVRVRIGSFRESPQNRGFSKLPQPLQWAAKRACPLLTVNAESIRKELIAEHLNPDRIILVPNCVEMQPHNTVPDLPEVLNGNFRLVGTVCNIRRNKNIHVFIAGLGLLMEKYPDLRGAIVGQPIPDEMDYYEEIQQRLKTENLADRIFLLGFRDDAPALMQSFKVFCLLSEFEGSPNAILEAMAAGRPVIATATSGIPDLVQDGVNGYLVPPGDANAFAVALDRLLTNPNLDEMGKAGYNLMQTHFSAQLLDLYAHLTRKL